MMQPIRDRWITRPAAAHDDGDEGRAGALLREAARRQPLADADLAAIGQRLRAGRPRGDRRATVRTPVWRVAIALALMLTGGALMAAATHVLELRSRRHPDAVPPPAVAPPRRASHDRTSRPPVAPPPAPPIAPAFAASRRRAPGALLSPPPPPEAPSLLGQESMLLGQALGKLRRENDPQGALALLDRHGARFAAGGALGPEASATRIEALLRLRRHGEALVLLDAMAPGPSGRGAELLVSRAELRAEVGRCAEALADFDAMLGAGGVVAEVLAERSLYGRAGCRARAADPAGARADLDEYLARFPDGRFAGEARRALGR